MKTQESVDECRFARAVGSEQSDGAALQNARQAMKDRPVAELYFELIELDGWVHTCQSIRIGFSRSSMIRHTQQVDQGRKTRIQVKEFAAAGHFDAIAFSISTEYARLGASCQLDRKSTRLNSSHSQISYAVFCLKKKKKKNRNVLKKKKKKKKKKIKKIKKKK